MIGILGYSHIRKDFGEKCGIFFTTLAYFIPIMGTNASEIRMYSWSCLFVTLMAIYAYRFFKNVHCNEKNGTLKNLVLFGIFSICSCYIHYYALVTSCLVNLLLLIYLVRKHKDNENNLKSFLIVVIIQILLYLPWIVFFVFQVIRVGEDFWIKVTPIGTFLEVISSQFGKEVNGTIHFDTRNVCALIISFAIYVYLGFAIHRFRRNNKDILPAKLAIRCIYWGYSYCFFGFYKNPNIEC